MQRVRGETVTHPARTDDAVASPLRTTFPLQGKVKNAV